MPYQNNNKRLNPEAVSDLKLIPQASPVNKEIKHQLDTSQAQQASQIAEGLVRLGKGLQDIDTPLRDMAKEAVVMTNAELAKDENRKEWATFSRSVQGVAKFNPYIKDEFKRSIGNDASNAAITKIISQPNVEKMPEEQFTKLLADTQAELTQSLKESGLNSDQAAPLLLKYKNVSEQALSNYKIKNAQYTYDTALIKFTANGSKDLAQAVYTAPESAKLTAVNQSINNTLKFMNDNGVYKDDQAKAVLGMIQDFTVNNPDLADSAVLEQAAKNVKINGQDISELIPNFGIQIHQTIRQAKRAAFEDKKLEWDEHKFDLEISTTNAMTDFFNWWKTNPNASGSDLYSKGLEYTTQYGVEENGLQFINYIQGLKSNYQNIMHRESDPTVLTELQYKAALGYLTGNDVANSLSSLSGQDAMNFMSYINREKTQEVSDFERKAKQLDKDYLDKNGAYYKEIKRIPNASTEIKQAVSQIREDLQTGKCTPQEANDALYKLKKTYERKANTQQQVTGNLSKLLDGGYRRSQSINEKKEATYQAAESFRKLGMIRNAQGAPQQDLYIASMPADYRPYSRGKHIGYDLGGAQKGKALYPPAEGQIVGLGTNNSMGNFVIMRSAKTGNYCLIMHLNDFNGLKKGQQINRNTVIGHVGSTGSVENKAAGSLHVEFWDKDLQWISATKFLKG